MASAIPPLTLYPPPPPPSPPSITGSSAPPRDRPTGLWALLILLGVVVGLIIGAAASAPLNRLASAWEPPCPWYDPGCPGQVPIGTALSVNWISSNFSGAKHVYVFDVRDVASPALTGGGVLRYANLTFAFLDPNGSAEIPGVDWTFSLDGPDLSLSVPMGPGFPSNGVFNAFAVTAGESWVVTEPTVSLSDGSFVISGGGSFSGNMTTPIQ